MNGGVNRAVTGMPTSMYRAVQVNLRPKEAAREALTDSMLGMTGTINCLVRDNLADGSSADAQLHFMQDQCAKAAKLLGAQEGERCSEQGMHHRQQEGDERGLGSTQGQQLHQ